MHEAGNGQERELAFARGPVVPSMLGALKRQGNLRWKACWHQGPLEGGGLPPGRPGEGERGRGKSERPAGPA